jgi:hypothetical protein
MGMIVTLYLISANVYSSVDAPKGKGFSYIEIWMIGTQFPILLALCQYGFVLFLKKVDKKSLKNPANKKRKVCSTIIKSSQNSPLPSQLNENQMLDLDEPQPDLDEKIMKLDFATMIFSLVYFITFVSLYWTLF